MKGTIALQTLICVATLLAAAQSRTDAESKVMALERLWGEAAQLRDIKALESIFDDEMTYVHIDGRLMTKSEVLADTRAVSAVEIISQSLVAHSHGDVVIVTGIMKLKGVESGKPYVRMARYVDTWLPQADHWVCISSMTTPVRP